MDSKSIISKYLFNQTVFPQNGCIFSAGAGSTDLTEAGYGGSDRHFRAAAAITTGGSLTATASSNNAGNHNHGTASGGAGSGKLTGDLMADSTVGGHTHSPTMNITYNLNAYNLSCWTDTDSTFGMEAGQMALYENETPPDGWYFCDGNNGTPDMRDQYVIIVTDGNEGSAGGDGTVDGTASAALTHSNHNHDTGDDNSTTHETANHTANTAMASHTATADLNNTWHPAYYALAWIMKA